MKAEIWDHSMRPFRIFLTEGMGFMSRSNEDDLHSCFHVADVGQEVLAKSDHCPGDVDPRPELAA